MNIGWDIVCDGCKEGIVTQDISINVLDTKGNNSVKMNGAEYDLCSVCYTKLIQWFNKEIAV